MSGADNVLFNNLERALSSDLNNLESMKDRVLLEELRFANEAKQMGSIGYDRAERNVVIGGLVCSPNGNDIEISPGVLAQYSTTLAPVPGTLDSDYRMGRLSAAEVIAMPVPGVDTWYLIEAQMTEVVALNQVRDIFNPGLGVFVPTAVDKWLVRSIQFQVVPGAAGALPLPTGGDWVAIHAVFRPAGGGAVGYDDIVDMRPFPGLYDTENWDKRTRETTITTAHVQGGAADNDAQVVGGVETSGCKMEYQGPSGVDWTDPSLVDPTTVLAADTWYYIYLCYWGSGLGNVTPPLPGIEDTNARKRGIVVLSHVEPVMSGSPLHLNSLDLNLPAPWTAATRVAGEAHCIGALRRNAANTGWSMQRSLGSGWHIIESITLASGAPVIGDNTVTVTGLVPLNAQAWRLRIEYDDAGGPTGALQLQIKKSAGGPLIGVYDGTVRDDTTFYFDVPAAFIGDTSFVVTMVGADAPTAWAVRLFAVHH